MFEKLGCTMLDLSWVTTFKAMVLVGFFGLLRVGEMTHSTHNIRNSSIMMYCHNFEKNAQTEEIILNHQIPNL